MSFEKKSVLITGGTGALGHVVAERFLKEGASVATSYIFEDELKYLTESFRKQVQIVRADVTDDEDVAALFHQVGSKFGKVDILINIVGGFVQGAPVKNVATKDWERMLDINLKSVFLCSRQYLNQDGDRAYGRIISMSAMPGLNPSAGKAAYSVSKAGVSVFTKVLGEELKGTGITANAIAPSIIRTPANEKSMPEEDLAKWVTPEEIADTMMFLCSANGRSVNGVTIPVYGGV
ncbi:MAG TPA: SDR family NAD(P)-dependent oxidoreductase [Bacteroidota bacterium]|nr:SDR family NAD(P)-dependent oxidoreductase [Bacteroidota bacterium]